VVRVRGRKGKGVDTQFRAVAEPAASADSLRSAALAAEPQAVRRHGSQEGLMRLKGSVVAYGLILPEAHR